MVNWGWTGATGAKFNEQRVCMNFTPNFVVVNGANKKVCSNVVQFQDSSTSSLNKIIGWDWDFGDASAHATTANPTHTFPGPGTYTVTLIITDQSGCQATKSYPVTVAPITIAGTVTPITCSGGTNGGVTTTVSGGSGVYTNYTWSNAATAQSISNVAAGTYTITVQDNTGCTNSNTFTLTDPAAIGWFVKFKNGCGMLRTKYRCSNRFSYRRQRNLYGELGSGR
jgi:PKD repeat protein